MHHVYGVLVVQEAIGYVWVHDADVLKGRFLQALES